MSEVLHSAQQSKTKSRQQMSDALNGMYWVAENLDFQIPFAGDHKKAAFIFRKNLACITWNCICSLEQNPATLAQVETILKGQSVGGISIFALMQVKHYGDAAAELLRLVKNDQFQMNLETAMRLHQFVGKDEAYQCGCVRTMPVTIRTVDYCPPAAEQLPNIATRGFAYLEKEIQDVQLRAIAMFLFMARNQFFFDANKRTASLMINGVLMQNGYWPIMILNRDSERFHELLGQFYETGNATEMFKFFEHSIRKMYALDRKAQAPQEHSR